MEIATLSLNRIFSDVMDFHIDGNKLVVYTADGRTICYTLPDFELQFESTYDAHLIPFDACVFALKRGGGKIFDYKGNTLQTIKKKGQYLYSRHIKHNNTLLIPLYLRNKKSRVYDWHKFEVDGQNIVLEDLGGIKTNGFDFFYDKTAIFNTFKKEDDHQEDGAGAYLCGWDIEKNTLKWSLFLELLPTEQSVSLERVIPFGSDYILFYYKNNTIYVVNHTNGHCIWSREQATLMDAEKDTIYLYDIVSKKYQVLNLPSGFIIFEGDFASGCHSDFYILKSFIFKDIIIIHAYDNHFYVLNKTDSTFRQKIEISDKKMLLGLDIKCTENYVFILRYLGQQLSVYSANQ